MQAGLGEQFTGPDQHQICKRTVLTKFGRSKSKAVAKYGMVRHFPGLCRNVVINRYRIDLDMIEIFR